MAWRGCLRCYIAGAVCLATMLVVASRDVVAQALAAPQFDALSLRKARLAERGRELRVAFELHFGDEAPQSLTVSLGADYIDVLEGGRETLYDLKLRRRLVLERLAGTFANYSLYGDVAFRQYDMENRVTLLRRLAQSGFAEVLPLSLKPFWIESGLGLRLADGQRAAITEEILENGARRFRLGGEEVAFFAPSREANVAPFIQLFAHFLRFRLPLHPDIIEAVAADGRLPERLVFVTVAGNERRPAGLILRHVEFVDSGDYPLPMTLRRNLLPASNDDLDSVTLRKALPAMLGAVAGKWEEGARSVASYRAAIDRALGRKEGFSAALLIAEMSLQYGRAASECAGDGRDASCPNANEINRVLATDPRAVALYRAQEASAKDPMQAVAEWQGLKRDDVAHGYVVDFFLASRESLSGNRAEAAASFESAMLGNPYIVRLYKDFGDHFLRGLRTDLAWLCYDLGRALPGREEDDALGEIDRIERQIVAQYPEFF